MSMIVAGAILTEFESGWGSRPDGVYMFTNVDMFEEFKQLLLDNQNKCPEEFTVVDTVATFSVSGELEKLITEKGGVWLHPRDISSAINKQELQKIGF